MKNDTLDWNSVRVGDPITPMRIDVTATVVVAGACSTMILCCSVFPSVPCACAFSRKRCTP